MGYPHEVTLKVKLSRFKPVFKKNTFAICKLIEKKQVIVESTYKKKFFFQTKDASMFNLKPMKRK